MTLRSIAVAGSRDRGERERSRVDLSAERSPKGPGLPPNSGLAGPRRSDESLVSSSSEAASSRSSFDESSSLGFWGGGSPPIDTGVAAPRFVAGAIAAMWLAYMMYVPALA